jgi:hypothetical protein
MPRAFGDDERVAAESDDGHAMVPRRHAQAEADLAVGVLTGGAGVLPLIGSMLLRSASPSRLIV